MKVMVMMMMLMLLLLLLADSVKSSLLFLGRPDAWLHWPETSIADLMALPQDSALSSVRLPSQHRDFD